MNKRYKLAVEEFDDICEVHVVVEYDFSVVLDQCQGDEEHKVGGANVLSRPYRLPHRKHVIVNQL